MKHPLLGEIRSTEDLFRETFFAFVEHERRSVRILIDPDGGPLETSVATAAAIKRVWRGSTTLPGNASSPISWRL
jgi:hypothetical protein